MKKHLLVLWIGLVIGGELCCSAVEEPLTLDNGNFERMQSTSDDFPIKTGSWSGDLSQIHHSPHNGIVPKSGKGVLQFIKTVPTPGPGGAPEYSSQVFQLIDLRKASNAVEKDGALRVTLEAFFNRVKSGGDTDTSFMVGLFAFDIGPDEFPAAMKNFRFLASSTRELLSDDDPATWENLTVSLRIPKRASLLAVVVMANENIKNNEGFEAEFDGHYVDFVSLKAEIVSK